MSEAPLNARRDQALGLVAEQRRMIAQLVAMPELFVSRPAGGLDCASLERFRVALEPLGRQLAAESGEPEAARTSLTEAIELLREQNAQLEAFLIQCRGELGDERERLNRTIADDRALLARLNEIYAKTHSVATELVQCCGPVLDGMRIDGAAALQAAANAYIKTGVVDRNIWLAELEHRLAASAESVVLPAGLADIVAMMPKPVSTLPGPPAFDPARPTLACDDAAAAQLCAAALTAPLQALAREGAAWTDRRLALANVALVRAVAESICAVLGPVLGEPGFKLELRAPVPPPAPTFAGLADAPAAAISQRMALRQSRQELSGSLARLGRWWRGATSDWGYEVRTSQEIKVFVAVDKLAAAVRKVIASAMADATATRTSRLFDTPIEEAMQVVQAQLAELRSKLRLRVDDGIHQRDAMDGARLGVDSLIKSAGEFVRQLRANRAALDAPPQPHAPPPPPHAPSPPCAPHGSLMAHGASSSPSRAMVEDIADATMVGDATMIGVLMSAMGARLELTYGEHKATLAGIGGRLTLGRDRDNSLMITGPRASRHHAEIVYNDGIYTITDTSTNGTIILGDTSEPVLIKHGSEILRGSGRIGLGVDPVHDTAHAIQFRCINPGEG
ncbi:MAG: FHA domain-containing protein [Rhodospirillaceae bacterium]